MRLRLPHKATRWAIGAGVSYVLCFPRFDLALFSLLFLPCMIFCVHALESRRQAIKLGFLLSAMVSWGGFHWIIYVAQNFGNMPLPLAIGLQLLFCIVAGPQMIAFLVAGFRFRFQIERLPLPVRPLFWAALYTSCEYVARHLKIFPEHLGNTLIGNLSLAQVASLGGVSLLSFIPLWLGASFFYLRKNGKPAFPSVAAALLFTLVCQFWGAAERKAVAALPTEIFRVGFVQHNMDEAEKSFARTSQRDVVAVIVGRLLEKTKELAASNPTPDLMLWPETSYPMSFPTSEPIESNSRFAYGYANLVKGTVEGTSIPLIFGGYETEKKKTYNAGILLGADGKVKSTYRKQVLLIFGEYFPFDSIFPSLKSLNPMMGDFGRGPGPVPLSFPWKGASLLLGVNICYEALLPEYMRGYALAGARLFVNLTKDSWFGDTFEPWQHFQLSALRSIEHRIPMVRITNTGLSGIVLPTGESKLLSDPFKEAYVVLDVPLLATPKPTLYTRFGEWFAWLMITLSVGIGIYAQRRSKPA